MKSKGETELEGEARIETVKMIGIQKYPEELEEYSEFINADVQEYGWQVAVMKAYCFGVINGKRCERMKKKR